MAIIVINGFEPNVESPESLKGITLFRTESCVGSENIVFDTLGGCLVFNRELISSSTSMFDRYGGALLRYSLNLYSQRCADDRKNGVRNDR